MTFDLNNASVADNAIIDEIGDILGDEAVPIDADRIDQLLSQLSTGAREEVGDALAEFAFLIYRSEATQLDFLY
jgi:hypothetical protein